MFWELVIFSLFSICVLTLMNIGGRNLIIFLLAIELLFFAGSLTCLLYFYSYSNSQWTLDMLFLPLVLTVIAAAESAVTLALIAIIYKRSKSIKIKKVFKN